MLYPSGFTKGEVIDYHLRIAPVMLPHLEGRCLTFKRFPDGTDAQGFFEKRCPKHRPEWVPVALGPGDRRGGVEYCRIEETAALVWAGNLAAIELHAPMALADDLDTPRAVVFDFDPGPQTDISDCCAIAIEVREILAAVSLQGWCKTSGSKGLQMYVPLNSEGVTHERAADFALAVGQVLERQLPKRVTTTMAKAVRPGKIFVDWSQNAFHKTTIAPYSLRARPEPTVSTPVSWDEVEASADGDVELRFEAGDVLERVAQHGDLFEPVLTPSSDSRTRRRDARAAAGSRGAGVRRARGDRVCGTAVGAGGHPAATAVDDRPRADDDGAAADHRRGADARRPRRRDPPRPTTTTPTAPSAAWKEFDEALSARLLGSGDFAVSVAVAVDGEARPQRRLRVPCAAAVRPARDGGTIERPAPTAPRTTVRSQRPDGVEQTDRFRIASISKILTATVVLQLVESAYLSLDQPVGQLLADHVGVRGPGSRRRRDHRAPAAVPHLRALRLPRPVLRGRRRLVHRARRAPG